MSADPNPVDRLEQAAKQFKNSGVIQLAVQGLLLEGVALEDSLMQPDGLHPTAAAQPMVLANVLPVVMQALAAKRAAKSQE